MKSLVFATNNKHKIYEINKVVGKKINILSLDDIKCFEDISETAETLEGNASQKSNYIFQKFHINCFADDTGLEVEALNGRPGVYSARYAGENKSFDDNINKILHELKEIIQIEQATRFKRIDESCNYEFHYSHKEHTELCSRLAGLLSQFIK